VLCQRQEYPAEDPGRSVQLRKLGLKDRLSGGETGNEDLLKKINKGATYAQIAEAGRRIKNAGINLSVTVLLGIGGIEKSVAHAFDTAKILTEIDPDLRWRPYRHGGPRDTAA